MITSYDQFVETSRALCRENLEMSTRWLLEAAAVNTAAMKVIDAALERHSAALEKVGSARDVEDLFDLNTTLFRDISEEWLQRATETGRQLLTSQMEALQSLHVDTYRFGDLYTRLMRFGTVPVQPLVAPWSLFADTAGRMLGPVFGPMLGMTGWLPPSSVRNTGTNTERPHGSKMAERKAS